MTDTLLSRLSEDLHALEICNQMRFLRPPKGIDFCSNDYLCLSKHQNVINAVKQALEQQGYGSSSSRFIRGERENYQPLQQRLAQFKRCDKALLFSSGYAAIIGTLTTLIKNGDYVFSDQ